MIASVSKDGELNYNAPRTIWVMGIQLFYAILAMIPVYYYLKNIVGLIQTENKLLLISLPMVSGFLLFGGMLMLNEYYFYKEIIILRRDILLAALKSSAFIIIEFYLVYMFFLGNFMNNANPRYLGPFTDFIVEKVFLELFLGLSITLLTVIGMISIQRYRPTRVK